MLQQISLQQFFTIIGLAMLSLLDRACSYARPLITIVAFILSSCIPIGPHVSVLVFIGAIIPYPDNHQKVETRRSHGLQFAHFPAQLCQSPRLRLHSLPPTVLSSLLPFLRRFRNLPSSSLFVPSIRSRSLRWIHGVSPLDCLYQLITPCGPFVFH